jgi:hypothetical protein
MRVLRLRMLAVKNSMKRRLARSPWAHNGRQRVQAGADQRRRRHHLVGQQDWLAERASILDGHPDSSCVRAIFRIHCFVSRKAALL